MTVLILSNAKTDGHVMPVARELLRRGVDVCGFDPGDFPGSAMVTTEWSHSGPSTLLEWNGETLDLADVHSIWLRRPERAQLSPELTREEEDWIRSECGVFLEGVWANTEALWVSAPHRLRLANRKLLQMRLAQDLGFQVPPYMVTNNPERAREFIDAQPDGAVVKALGVPTLLHSLGAAMVYTHRIVSEDLAYLDSVRNGPTFIQAFVPKLRDIRVTIIGKQIFAVAIESTHVPGGDVDFRVVDTFELPHIPVQLPEPVERACLALLERLNLQFGAIDLLETKNGDYVFLENNPNGQWYWIELMTGLPMAEAMADLLERGLHGQATRPPERPRGEPFTVPVGDQVVPVRSSLAAKLQSMPDEVLPRLTASSTWLERRNRQITLHVGDIDDDESRGA